MTTIRYTILLTIAQAVTYLSLIGGQSILLRATSVSNLGLYAFLINIFSICALAFDYGYGPAVAREIAVSKEPEEQNRLLASLSKVLRGVVLGYMCTMLIAVLISSQLVDQSLIIPGLIGAFVGAGFLLKTIVNEGLVAQRNIAKMIILTVLPAIGQLLCFSLLAIWGKLSLTNAFVVHAALFSLVSASFIISAKGEKICAGSVKTLASMRRAYGRDVWIGRLVGTGAFMLDIPLLSLFAPPDAIGRYLIVKTLCMPLCLVSANIGSVLFRSMATQHQIPIRVQAMVWATNLSGTFLLIPIGIVASQYIYGIDTREIIVILSVQAVASALNGLYTLYNNFLRAHAQGKSLLYGGIGFGVLNLLLNATLVPSFAELGCCIANVISSAVWLTYCLVMYSRLKRQHSVVDSQLSFATSIKPCTQPTPQAPACAA